MSIAPIAPAKIPNPFASLAVQDGDHADDLVDVALHEQARVALDRGRRRVRSGHAHVTALIGAEGSGKSHLLWWLRRQNSAPGGLYVPIQALPDLAQPYRHALRQLVSALCRKSPPTDPSSPFERPIDRLLWDVLYQQTLDLLDAARISLYQGPATLLKLIGPLCLDSGRRRPLGDFAKAAQEVWAQVEPGLRAYLLSLPTEAAIDSAARAVVVQYPYTDRRALISAWLAGEELGAKERERLSAKQVINNESAAKYVLCALCRLLTKDPAPGPAAPLVIAYDQTDQVADQLGPPGVQAIAEVIATVQMQGGAVLQVLSCRPDSWKLLHQKHDRTGSSQLKQIDDTLHLGAASAQQLRQLIAARAGKLVALSASDLDPQSWPVQFATPRQALEHFSRRQQPGEAVPLPATDAPTAKGLPSEPLRGAAKATAPGQAKGAAVAAKREAPSKPGVVGKKDAPSTPGSPAKPAKESPPRPVQSAAKVEPKPAPPPVAAPPPSTQSPSVAWLVMAGGEEGDPLAAALAQYDAAAALPSPASAKPATKPVPAKPVEKPVVKPADKPAPAKPVKSAAPAATAQKPQPAAAAAKPVKSPPPSSASPSLGWLTKSNDQPPAAATAAKPAAPAKAVLSPLAAPPPSSQSPSVTWMAMASDDDPLAQALAAAEREDAAAARRPRTTKERLPAIESPPPGTPTAQQVLTAIGRRERVEEWLLARELGVSMATLGPVLAQLEDQGSLRLLPLGDGQRTVARIGR